MVKKYKITRVSLETYNNLKQKQQRMSTAYQKLTGKQKMIPVSRVLNMISKQPIYLTDFELKGIFKKRSIKI